MRVLNKSGLGFAFGEAERVESGHDFAFGKVM